MSAGSSSNADDTKASRQWNSVSKGFVWSLLGATLLTMVVIFSAYGPATNCGGNSAALSAVHSYLCEAMMGANDSSDGRFDVKATTAEQRRRISDLPGARWLRGAHLLVSSVPFAPKSGEPRRVVIVCDKPYTNVPQRRFFESPSTHAAGFPDGTTGLISPKELAALDRSSFIAIDELFTPEKTAHEEEPSD